MNVPIRLLWITPPRGGLESLQEQIRERRSTPGLAVLLRRPDADLRTLLTEARWLQSLGVPVLVQRVDVALATGAEGVHLPERGLPVAEARRLLPNRIVGASRHGREGLLAARDGGADYATLSPFAATPGKGPPLGPEGFESARRGVAMPVLALGGIDETTGRAALLAGADGVAFIRAGAERTSFDALLALMARPS